MINILLIILPLLIPAIVLGHFFVRLLSRQPDKYERIYEAFLYVNPTFTSGGHRRFAGSCEEIPHSQP